MTQTRMHFQCSTGCPARKAAYLCKSRSSLSQTSRGTEKIRSQCCPIVGRLPSLRSTAWHCPDGRPGWVPGSQLTSRKARDRSLKRTTERPLRDGAMSGPSMPGLGTTGMIVGEAIQGSILPCLFCKRHGDAKAECKNTVPNAAPGLVTSITCPGPSPMAPHQEALSSASGGASDRCEF